MYNLIVKETEQEVLEHFNSLGIDGVGFETTTPNVIWHKIPHDYSQDYLTFVSKANNNTLQWKATSDENTRTISVSTDNGETWAEKTSTTGGTVLAVLNNGDRMLIKGNNANYGNDDEWWYNQFTSTGYYDVEGNIMSLVGGDNFTGLTTLDSGSTFLFLFSAYDEESAEYFDSYLQSAGNLVLPATILSDYCYESMFDGCNSLTTTPKLPATTLADGCYSSMFSDCSTLTTTPELPATTLADWCYWGMFSGCTSLTAAPILPATTLADGCYSTMFQYCSSLIAAPELPATMLTEQCYDNMFVGCSSLNYVKCLATDISASECTQSWLSEVSATGTFVKNPLMPIGSGVAGYYWPIGGSYGIPVGWTVVDAS